MYQYRWGQPSDLPWMDQAVAAGTLESLSEEQRAAAHPLVTAQQAQMRLRHVLFGPGSAAFVAQVGSQPVGHLVIAIGPDGSTEEPTAHLIELWVAPAHRRRGVASGLLSLAEQWIASLGLRKLKLWTGLHQRPVVSFAERRGFRTAGLIGVIDLVTADQTVT